MEARGCDADSKDLVGRHAGCGSGIAINCNSFKEKKPSWVSPSVEPPSQNHDVRVKAGVPGEIWVSDEWKLEGEMVLDSHPRPSGVQLPSLDSKSFSDDLRPALQGQAETVLENCRAQSWKGARDDPSTGGKTEAQRKPSQRDLWEGWAPNLCLMASQPMTPTNKRPKILGLCVALLSPTPLYRGIGTFSICCPRFSASQPGDSPEREDGRGREGKGTRPPQPSAGNVFCWTVAPRETDGGQRERNGVGREERQRDGERIQNSRGDRHSEGVGAKPLRLPPGGRVAPRSSRCCEEGSQGPPAVPCPPGLNPLSLNRGLRSPVTGLWHHLVAIWAIAGFLLPDALSGLGSILGGSGVPSLQRSEEQIQDQGTCTLPGVPILIHTCSHPCILPGQGWAEEGSGEQEGEDLARRTGGDEATSHVLSRGQQTDPGACPCGADVLVGRDRHKEEALNIGKSCSTLEGHQRLGRGPGIESRGEWGLRLELTMEPVHTEPWSHCKDSSSRRGRQGTECTRGQGQTTRKNRALILDPQQPARDTNPLSTAGAACWKKPDMLLPTPHFPRRKIEGRAGGVGEGRDPLVGTDEQERAHNVMYFSRGSSLTATGGEGCGMRAAGGEAGTRSTASTILGHLRIKVNAPTCPCGRSRKRSPVQYLPEIPGESREHGQGRLSLSQVHRLVRGSQEDRETAAASLQRDPLLGGGLHQPPKANSKKPLWNPRGMTTSKCTHWRAALQDTDTCDWEEPKGDIGKSTSLPMFDRMSE
ncbi:hypothetical protein Cadr_000026290 [Camelus dromedarius]|uniref:Uncharacterized protein n=1 Tax=Camelus dromedarius TaxID=9838 RepID=A0A5N4CET5_CAMDR|nr:hypothetical protein Cadr_000026290 [Camelus dromedarius]